MVKQHLSWFHKPENAVGALMHRLTVDATNIYQVSFFLLKPAGPSAFTKMAK